MAQLFMIVRNGFERKQKAAFILALAAGLRFYGLAGHSLWADEGNSLAMARRGWGEIARHTAFDIHPPLYYWLLKLWTGLVGQGEIGLRSLSAGLGVGLVYVVYRLGVRLFNRRVGLVAALLAALSPLQVYYAQEARMYMLLALLGGLTVLTAWPILAGPPGWRGWPEVAYGLVVTAGLYTHYAYPLMLVVVNLAALARLRTGWRRWLALQAVPLLLYAPWLPVAWRQVTTWPTGGTAEPAGEVLGQVAVTLFFGLSWPFGREWLALGLLLGLTGWLAARGRYRWRLGLLWVWLLLPVGLTVLIFSPAFLKFLLVTGPALALLLALSLERVARWRPPRAGRPAAAALLLLLSGASALSLSPYYTNPAYARDNYRGLVAFLKAVGGPEDAIILHAEGQQDVFNYYYRREPAAPMPVYPLPRQRPLDEAATLRQLQQIADRANRVYAVYWATEQADPTGLIEGWLDTHLFKATDWWYGNVRLVSYATPQADLVPQAVDYRLGPDIRLAGYALSAGQVAPGQILQLALAWQTEAPLADNYTVFAQLLDGANHLVGQRDAPPGLPTTAWPVGVDVPDRHGLFVEPGTPPGPHRLIVGLYHSQAGLRLPVAGGGDFVELGRVEVVSPASPLPVQAFDMQQRLDARLGGVTLLGYDLHKLGHGPQAPLYPGDMLHLVAYWRADQPEPGEADHQLAIQPVTGGGQPLPPVGVYPPAGVDFPIRAWQPGRIIRAQYDLPLTAEMEPGQYRLRLTLGEAEPVLTGPFEVARP